MQSLTGPLASSLFQMANFRLLLTKSLHTTISCLIKMTKFLKLIENAVGKGEIAH